MMLFKRVHFLFRLKVTLPRKQNKCFHASLISGGHCISSASCCHGMTWMQIPCSSLWMPERLQLLLPSELHNVARTPTSHELDRTTVPTDMPGLLATCIHLMILFRYGSCSFVRFCPNWLIEDKKTITKNDTDLTEDKVTNCFHSEFFHLFKEEVQLFLIKSAFLVFLHVQFNVD